MIALLSKNSIWLKAAAIAAIALSLCAVSAPAAPGVAVSELKGPPADGEIYFIGNSMFGTGLDMEQVKRALPGENATFGYYNGAYTNMWYAAIRNGLVPSGVRPKVVVWGFRPTYANLPAFRQNKPMDLEKFIDSDDKIFESILQNAGDPAYPAGGEPAAPLSANDGSILGWMNENLPVMQRRTALRDALTKSMAHLSARAFAGGSPAARDFLAPDSQLKVSDLIVAFATGGDVRRADALVVDNGEQFIKGREVSFDDSFAPRIAAELDRARIPQLVVIFKPVSVFGAGMPPGAQAYYEEAVAYFEAQRIPYLDLVADDALTQELYAKGDHYTAEGMTYVTGRIIEKLRDMDSSPS